MFRQLLRLKKRQVIVLWLLVIVFVLPLILFFHAGSVSQPSGPGGIAGEIFGRKIPWETFQAEYRLLTLSLQTQLGFLPEGLEAIVQQQTWDRLILKEEARRTQRVSKEEVAASIRRQPQFQQDGRFVPELYFQSVRALGGSPQAFEDRVREELRIQKLIEQAKAETLISEEDLRQAYAQIHDRIRAAFVVINPADVEPSIRGTLTEEAARAAFSQQAETFRRPEQRTIESLGLTDQEALAKTGGIADEDIQQFYEARQDEWTNEDGAIRSLEDVRGEILDRLSRRRVQASLTDLALDLQADRSAGVSFEDIALRRGLTPKTLGPVARGTPGIPDGPTASMIEAAFAIPLEQMTDVLEAPTGVFLLRPTQEHPSHLPSFDEIKKDLIDRLIHEKAREQARTDAEQLRGQLLTKRELGLTFDEACASLGLHPEHVEPITRQDPVGTVGHAPQITQALFALEPGHLSDVLEGPQGWIIGMVEERMPFDAAQFEKDREAFRETVLVSQQQEDFLKWMEPLRGRARLKSFLESPTER